MSNGTMDNDTMVSNDTCVITREDILNEVSTYECSEKGLILPLTNEYTWSKGFRGTLYLIGLLWCFLGVAIIADVFMCAIEKITSKTRRIRVADPEAEEGYSVIEVKVWNNTVANLTLMALGSSAPEILLACIEIVGAGFEAGPLGPSTIVGSAAFNLFVISGVCVFSIPSPDTRRIDAIKVFFVTAFFCLFAYVWLIIVLVVNTKDVVDVEEGVITLLFFPLLVGLAYLADKNFCMKKKPEQDDQVGVGFGRLELIERSPHSKAGSLSRNYGEKIKIWRKRKGRKVRVNNMVKRFKKKGGYSPPGQDLETEVKGSSDHVDSFQMRQIIKELRSIHPNLTDEDISKLATLKLQEDQSHNHLWYRINATRRLGGSHKLTPSFDEALEEIYAQMKGKEHEQELQPIEEHFIDDMSEKGTKAVVEFSAARLSVMENDKSVRLNLLRYGKVNSRCLIRLETIDGTAESEKDYKPVKTTIVFEKDEAHKFVDIEIIDDNEWEPDEVFFVKLSLDPEEPKSTILGHISICEVTIINDDEPGSFEFAKPSLIVKESAGKALIPIERSNGCDGTVTLKWRTEDMTAMHGKDFQGGEGTITFEHGETTKTLELPVYDDQEFEKDETFKVDLLEVDVKGAKLGRVKKTIVTIVNDDEFNGMVARLVNMTNANLDSLRVDSTTWGQQFQNAMNVNGGDLEGATNMDYIMHFLTFGWKLIFALVPPPSYLGGWLCFFVALAMIGLLTCIVGDLASIFGCLSGLLDPVTAITFVALGTSLPDLFASKQAATTEKTADNSIGNVTGSNSVNVFLGLGLPWTIASIYHESRGEKFNVKAGSLAFSVMLYAICAILCLGTLLARRYLSFFGKAELGGPKTPKIITFVFFVTLWLLYVLFSSLEVYGVIPGF